MKYKQKKEIFKCKFWNQMKNKNDENFKLEHWGKI